MHRCLLLRFPLADVPPPAAPPPLQLKCWLRYLDHKAKASPVVRFQIYERALKQLPGSYKLWYRYLKERRRDVRGISPTGTLRCLAAAAISRSARSVGPAPEYLCGCDC